MDGPAGQVQREKGDMMDAWSPRWRWTNPPLRLRVELLLGAMIALLLVTAAGDTLVRLQLDHATREVARVLEPAQGAANQLEQASVDQQAGQREFLITGHPAALRPYQSGAVAFASASSRLASLLADYPTARGALQRAEQKHQQWQVRSTEEISARRQGSSEQAAALVATGVGARRFGELRTELGVLSQQVDRNLSVQLHRVSTMQSRTTWLTGGTLVLAALLGIATLVGLRRSLSRPLVMLVSRVRAVADGDLNRPVQVVGPPELVSVANAVERMRVRILAESSAAVEARRRVTLFEEDERIARDLHDTVIQRLFATGMSLQAAVARHPEHSDRLSRAIDEIDGTIREIRTVIFGLTVAQRAGAGLRQQVLATAVEAERSLGFMPHVEFDGPVDAATPGRVAEELLPTLREALSNIARHARASEAEIEVRVLDGTVQLRVTDNGVGLPKRRDGAGRGLRNIPERATRLGGSCTIGAGPRGGTVVDWQVPTAG